MRKNHWPLTIASERICALHCYSNREWKKRCSWVKEIWNNIVKSNHIFFVCVRLLVSEIQYNRTQEDSQVSANEWKLHIWTVRKMIQWIDFEKKCFSYFVSPKYPDGCWLSWATSAPCLPLFSIIHALEEWVIWFLVQFYFLI